MPRPVRRLAVTVAPVLFLYGFKPSYKKIRRGSVDGFAGPSAKTIVCERRGETSSADARELISRIPRIRRGDARIRAGGQVAIQIIRRRSCAEGELLIVGIVVRRREGGWQTWNARRSPPVLTRLPAAS